jgi:hypothetical protein
MNLLHVVPGSLRSNDYIHRAWKSIRNVLVVAALLSIGSAGAQQEPSASPFPNAGPDKGSILLTIFLRHDQSKPLDELTANCAGKAITRHSHRPESKSFPGT